jgi:hypothetical protein
MQSSPSTGIFPFIRANVILSLVSRTYTFSCRGLGALTLELILKLWNKNSRWIISQEVIINAIRKRKVKHWLSVSDALAAFAWYSPEDDILSHIDISTDSLTIPRYGLYYGDSTVPRLLPAQDNTKHREHRLHYVPSGIQTYEPNVGAIQDLIRPRPRDRDVCIIWTRILMLGWAR